MKRDIIINKTYKEFIILNLIMEVIRMKKTSTYPIILEKTSFGNYRIIFPDLNAKFPEETLGNCGIIAKIYLEKILEGRIEFKTKEIDSIEKLKEIYFRRTKQHIKDMTKIHIEYIEVEEKVY